MSAFVPIPAPVQSSSGLELKDRPGAPAASSSFFRDAYARHAPRVALVTGAAQGIGRGISLRLAGDGYKVALVDLRSQLEALVQLRSEIVLTAGGKENRKKDEEEEEEEEEEERTVVIHADVSKEEDVRFMVDRCVETLGGLDVMVANAGIAIYKPILEQPVEDFDKAIAVNLRGPYLCYKYAAKQMIKQGRGGRIIGASSMYGKAGAPNLSGYSASKFGIRGLSHTAAAEWAKYGITVNTYAPARIRTPMLDDYDTQLTSTTEGMKKGDFLELMKTNAPLGYLAGPEEIASIVAYLASPEAHFITGQTVSVNGGALLD